jgi:hypothetical protein
MTGMIGGVHFLKMEVAVGVEVAQIRKTDHGALSGKYKSPPIVQTLWKTSPL